MIEIVDHSARTGLIVLNLCPALGLFGHTIYRNCPPVTASGGGTGV
jgi:hypothetical protein